MGRCQSPVHWACDGLGIAGVNLKFVYILRRCLAKTSMPATEALSRKQQARGDARETSPYILRPLNRKVRSFLDLRWASFSYLPVSAKNRCLDRAQPKH